MHSRMQCLIKREDVKLGATVDTSWLGQLDLVIQWVRHCGSYTQLYTGLYTLVCNTLRQLDLVGYTDAGVAR